MAREEEFQSFEEGEGGRGASPRRFTAAELVACEACLRANAPTRMSCLYCGAKLPLTEESAAHRRPELKRLEEWEQGFNVVLLSRGAPLPARDVLEEAAALLRLGAERLGEMLGAGHSLPLARASSAEEAELVVTRLGALGLAAAVFADEELARPPARVRALDFEEGGLVLRQGPDTTPRRVPWGEVALLVKGRVVSRRVEFAERRARFGGRSELVEARELAADEAVLDVYAAGEGDWDGFRILSSGFDYSCLGARKRLLAAENFEALVETLRGAAAAAEFDEDYARLRPLLTAAWPAAEQTESLGLRRERAGRVNTEAVTRISNEGQFTRYARLRQRLALRRRAENR